MSLFDQLKRRNVIRVATAYVVTAWLLLQVIDTVLRGIWLSDETYRLIVIGVGVGFFLVLVLSWLFQFTPEGLRVDSDSGDLAASPITARRIDRAISVVLAIAVTYFIVEKNLEVAATPPVIAVLPFENVGTEPEHDLFVTAMTYAVRDLLTDVPGLTVISRASTELALERYGRDIPAIRESLGVAHVLDGTVHAIGTRLRIDVQLIEAATQSNRWSDSYERPLADHYQIQDAIAAELVGHLRLQLAGAVPQADPVDPSVLSLVTAARLNVQRMTPGSSGKTLDLLEQALGIDPNYVPALEYMVAANAQLEMEGAISEQEFHDRYDVLRERILELDPDNALVMFRDVIPRSIAGHFEEVAQVYSRLIEANPSDSRLLRMGAVFARRLGKYDVSERLLNRAITVDPLCYRCLYDLSRLQFELEDYQSAVATRSRYLELGTGGNYHYGLMLLLMGQVDAAREHFETMDDSPARQAAGLSMIYFTLGNLAESERQLEVLRAMLGTDHPDYTSLVDVAAWTGRTDLAFEALALQREEHVSTLVFHIGSPVWKPLHTDPRWQALLVSLNQADPSRSSVNFDPVLPR